MSLIRGPQTLGVTGSGGSVDTGSLVLTSSFNPFTASINNATSSIISQSLNIYSSESNYLPTSSFQNYTASTNTQILNVYASESNYTPTASFNPTTASLNNFTGSILSYTASTNIQIANVYASESNYLLTSSFVNTGTLSGSGTNTYFPFYNSPTSFTSSIMFQTGSGTGSQIIIGNTASQAMGPIMNINGFLGISQSLPISPIDVYYYIPTINADVMVMRLQGNNTLGGANRNTFIKLGGGGAATAFWDINNSGGGFIEFRYGNSNTTLAATIAFALDNLGNASFARTISATNLGTISGSGTTGFIPVFSGSLAISKSLLFQSGSGTSSAMLLGLGTSTGSGSALLQIYGNTYFSGSIQDSTQTLGGAGQVLVAGVNGIVWISTASLASLNSYTGSTNTTITNVFASESNYLPTASFINIGTISGSGTATYLAFFDTTSHISKSLFFQSGSGTSSAMLLNASAGSGSAIFQIYGTTYHSGGIQDSAQNLGSAGQTLVAGANGVIWTLTASLASLNTFSASANTQITNVFASESNYLPTASFINVGTISGSGVLGNLAVFSGVTSISKSLFFQSGSGTSSAMLLGIGVSAGSGSALLQIYGTTYHSGGILDSTQAAGAAGQTLVAGANGILWVGTASLASLNTYTGSTTTTINNVFASESNYLPTASFVNVGTISGSGVLGNLAVFSGITSISKSLFFQSGSGTSSAMLLGVGVSAGSGSALLQIYGNTYFSGAIYDSTQTLGSAGQTLVAGANGLVWILTASLASLNIFSASANTQITNVFASESNYLPTSSFVNIGTISGSGGSTYIPYYKTNTGLSQSLIYQSGSNSGSVLLINPLTFTGSNTALVQIFGATYLSGGIFDSFNTTGSINQVLVSTGATGVKWVASSSGGGTTYDPTNLNAATNSLQLFSSSILTYTSSTATLITNVFSSESNYLPTSSFVNIGTISGSGTATYLALFSGNTSISKSLFFQSGSGTSSAMLLNAFAGSGSSILQIYGNTYFSGAIQDSTQTLGSAGQTLVAGANGVVWTLTASLASLNSYTGSTNTTITNVFASESNYLPTASFVNVGTISGSGLSGYISMFSGNTSVSLSIAYQSGSGTGSVIFIGATSSTVPAAIFQVFGNMYISKSIYDSAGRTGSANQVLTATSGGASWIGPLYAQSLLLMGG